MGGKVSEVEDRIRSIHWIVWSTWVAQMITFVNVIALVSK